MGKIETEPFDIGDRINDLRKELEGKIALIDTKVEKRVPLWALYSLISILVVSFGGVIAYLVTTNDRVTQAGTQITVIETKLGIHNRQ